MRQLASIQKIIDLQPIAGADRIECATVLGWNCVVKKGQFKVDDLCVFFEIDSVLPDRPEFEFLRREKFRLKTQKFKKQISQGLAWPVTLIQEEIVLFEGQDVTKLLGVTKYDPPSRTRGVGGKNAAGPRKTFPTHLVSKTDESRIQSNAKLIAELEGVECYASVKMDGQSLTLIKHDKDGAETRLVCSRNFMKGRSFTVPARWSSKELRESGVEADLPPKEIVDYHWEFVEQEGYLDRMPVGFAVQGEFCGPSIQQNRIGLAANSYFAYQVFDLTERRFLNFRDFLAFCKEFNIPHVPIEQINGKDTFVMTEEFLIGIHKKVYPNAAKNTAVGGLVEMSKGKYPNGHEREGLVIRPVEERRSERLGGRTSFKVINPEFLLKTNDQEVTDDDQDVEESIADVEAPNENP